MNKLVKNYPAEILVPFFLLVSQQVGAVAHPYEFHADAKMKIAQQGPVDRAYGYINVITDPNGDGEINVMFSNASRVNEAEFNAQVKFLNQSGAVIKEESFNCWIDSTGFDEPIECKISKPVTLTDFESIKVDFFLTDIKQ